MLAVHEGSRAPYYRHRGESYWFGMPRTLWKQASALQTPLPELTLTRKGRASQPC